jgi:hypothetical protein
MYGQRLIYVGQLSGELHVITRELPHIDWPLPMHDIGPSTQYNI